MKMHWGLGISLVYAVFAAATTGFVVFAMDQPVDLVNEDYYARAVRQDSRMMAIANTAALGAAFRADVAEDGRTLTLRWPAGAQAESGSLSLYRPSDAAADRRVPLALHAQRQDVDLATLRPGRWVAQVEWQSQGRSYYAERTVVA